MLINWLERFGSRFETGFIVTDPAQEDDPIVFVNKAFTTITGYSFTEVEGCNLRFLQGVETDINVIKEINEDLRKAIPVNAEILNYKKDGTPFWNELVIQPLVNGRGEVLYNISFSLDVTGRKKDESLLKLQEAIFIGINEGEDLNLLLQKICNVAESFFPIGAVCSILFNGETPIWTIGAADSMSKPLIREVIKNATTYNNYIDDEILIVKNIQDLTKRGLSVDVSVGLGYKANWTVPTVDIDGKQNGVFTVFIKREGSPSKAQIQFMQKLVPIIRMTVTYYNQQKQYLSLAFIDPETSLPNNHAFLKKLDEEMKNSGTRFVATIHPGEYSKIVDLYGRSAVSELFIQLTRRIKKMGQHKGDFVGRFSSASLILMNDITLDDNGQVYTLLLKAVVSKPFVIAGQEMFITLKVGIAFQTEEVQSAEELIRRADAAMTEAKNIPGNAMSIYKNRQNEELLQDMTIFNELTKALTADELEVHLQPKVSLLTSEVIGFEALARWNSSVLGQVPPNVFIPVAENTGKIIDLETIVLNKVMKWQQKRLLLGKKLYQVAVNISVDHFFDPNFTKLLNDLIRKYDIPAKYLRLEITESIGLVDFAGAKYIFEELNTTGFEVSIDDFGVGYSSLSYLTQLRVSELKIDRSFIQALDDPSTHAVVMTIIQLANNLGISTVAEGIEEERHIDILISLGCQIGQGFFYYKPMPIHKADLLLEKA